MEVLFKSINLQKTCSSLKALKRAWGSENGARIARRLVEMEAAATLADLFTLPQVRCHQLVGDRVGQFAVDCKHPFRLIFEPADEPIPTKPDRGIDVARVTRVRVLEIGDYHGN